METSWVALVGAGLAAGISGTVTGIGSVFSYPALLAVGLPATAANVTNTVSLAVGGLGGVLGSRRELVGQAGVAFRLALAGGLGTLVGSVLLLISPPGVFERVVPLLVAAGSLAILLPRRHPIRGCSDNDRNEGPVTVAAPFGIFGVSIYNGYFAAAGGVLIMAVLLITTSHPIAQAGALRNVLIATSDLLAALTFALFGPVSWPQVPPLAIGLLVGSWLGPGIARRIPARKLRPAIAVAGVGLAIKLAVDTI